MNNLKDTIEAYEKTGGTRAGSLADCLNWLLLAEPEFGQEAFSAAGMAATALVDPGSMPAQAVDFDAAGCVMPGRAAPPPAGGGAGPQPAGHLPGVERVHANFLLQMLPRHSAPQRGGDPDWVNHRPLAFVPFDGASQCQRQQPAEQILQAIISLATANRVSLAGVDSLGHEVKLHEHAATHRFRLTRFLARSPSLYQSSLLGTQLRSDVSSAVIEILAARLLAALAEFSGLLPDLQLKKQTEKLIQKRIDEFMQFVQRRQRVKSKEVEEELKKAAGKADIELPNSLNQAMQRYHAISQDNLDNFYVLRNSAPRPEPEAANFKQLFDETHRYRFKHMFREMRRRQSWALGDRDVMKWLQAVSSAYPPASLPRVKGGGRDGQPEWFASPWFYGTLLTRRFPQGPLLLDKELELIANLSNKPKTGAYAGRDWLAAAGLMTLDRIVDYLRKHKYYDWLKLDAATRVVMASVAFEGIDRINALLQPLLPKERLRTDHVAATPSFRLGRSMACRQYAGWPDRTVAARADLARKIDDDICKEWYRTFLPFDREILDEPERGGLPEAARHAIQQGGMRKNSKLNASFSIKHNTEKALRRNAKALEILRKVLLLLHAGLNIYDKNQNRHVAFDGSVCRALSHGGRVNIKIPPRASGQSRHALTDWLGLTKDGKRQGSPVFGGDVVIWRSFGTHHVELRESNHGQTEMIETGGGMAALNNWGPTASTSTWGIDLPMGGLGRTDFNGDVILPDGGHGHMFIGYRPPGKGMPIVGAKDPGALEIGLETTGPGAANPVGYHHGPESTEATANPESSVGGLKQDKIGSGTTPKAKFFSKTTKNQSVKSTTTYDFRTFSVTNDDQKTKRKITADETLARYVDLTNLRDENGNPVADWLGYLNRLDRAFALLKRAPGGVKAAYHDLVGNGALLKAKLPQAAANASVTNQPPPAPVDPGRFLTMLDMAAQFEPDGDQANARLLELVAGDTVVGDNSALRPVVYRLQSAVDNGNATLVQTQDSVLVYRQVAAARAAGHGPRNTELRTQVTDNTDGYFYRTLTYSAVVARWFYPNGQAASTVPLRAGSGVVFGCSINLERLENYQGNDAVPSLARQLRLPEAIVRRFLEGCEADTLDPRKAHSKIEEVLLEASFAFPEGRNADVAVGQRDGVNVFMPSDLFAQPAVGDFLPLLDGNALSPQFEQLRLRVRNCDLCGGGGNQPEKLGFVARNADLTASSIDGSTGTTNLWVRSRRELAPDENQDDNNDNGAQMIGRDEQVPPLILMAAPVEGLVPTAQAAPAQPDQTAA